MSAADKSVSSLNTGAKAKVRAVLRHVKHPFPAVIDEGCSVLILGSVPSVKSVENNFYYMHPQNRFWKIMSAVVGCDLVNVSKDAKARILLERGIALYDSIEECDITGSSDSAITNIAPADIPALLRSAQIRRILCNGTASYEYLISYYPELKSIADKLPSTSPANAAFSLERLTEIYAKAIMPFIIPL